MAASEIWAIVILEMCLLYVGGRFEVFHGELLSFPPYLSSAKSALGEEKRLPQTQTAGKRNCLLQRYPSVVCVYLAPSLVFGLSV